MCKVEAIRQVAWRSSRISLLWFIFAHLVHLKTHLSACKNTVVKMSRKPQTQWCKKTGCDRTESNPQVNFLSCRPLPPPASVCMIFCWHILESLMGCKWLPSPGMLSAAKLACARSGTLEDRVPTVRPLALWLLLQSLAVCTAGGKRGENHQRCFSGLLRTCLQLVIFIFTCLQTWRETPLSATARSFYPPLYWRWH